MKSTQKVQNEFLNPYRENKRCFVKYFKGGSNINLSLSKNSLHHHQNFLDNVSKASSMKFRDESVQNHQKNQSQVESSLKGSQFIIMNKRKVNDLQNPEMFQLLSKHIERTQSVIKKPRKMLSKPAQSLLSDRVKVRSNSVFELQKIPKITQFSRETFYRNPSFTNREYSSKKQKQDFLHSNSNLDINTKKQAISKKTRPYKDSRSFVTYELYSLNRRVGIDVQILAGALKQIKFRLIMNQSDTKTFHSYWVQRIDEFIDKCLSINEDGISLRVGSFNFESSGKKKSSSRKHVQRVYLEHYEASLKRNSQKKVTKKIGHINFSQEYQPNEVENTVGKEIINENLQIESNSKNMVRKQILPNEQKVVQHEKQQDAKNESIVQVDFNSIKETVEKQNPEETNEVIQNDQN